jgi:AcrR family transcriptional regulator
MNLSRLTGSAQDRLLLAAAELMDNSGDRDLSTRAVCARAGVQAPTLYHHFGSKQGLIDAVINHGFTQYVHSQECPDGARDPVGSVRQGWDAHVRFGLDHPRFYALLYGRIKPGQPCTITAPAHAMLRDLLAAAARQGLLAVPPDAAADRILAANTGVTLSLIAQPEQQRDMSLSASVREAVLGSVLLHAARPPGQPPATCASAALVMRTLLDQNPAGLTAGEHALLSELLDRLAAS